MSSDHPFHPDNVIPFDGSSDGIEQKRNLFEVQSCAEFAILQTDLWHIKGMIPKASLIEIYGAPGCGKTFAALDIGMSIARGLPLFCDKKVRQGRVVYICAEAPSGFRNRILAYALHHNIPLTDISYFQIISDAPDFLRPEKGHAKAVAVRIGRADIIFVDTLARTMPGGEESGSRDMGMVIAACQELHELTGATIVLIHHSGKNQDNGARGWSGLLGAVDAEIKVEKINNDHQLTITKQKDGEAGAKFGFALNPVSLGTDEDGDPITSCVFEPSNVLISTKKQETFGLIEKLIMECFDEFHQVSVEMGDLKPRVISRMERGEKERDLRPQKFSRAFDTLREKGKFDLNNMIVSRTFQPT